MKKYLPIFVLACFMFFLSPQITNAQTNIVENNGFEQGKKFWVFSSSATVSLGDGCFGAQLANAELSHNSSTPPVISQIINIPSTGVSQLSLSLKSDVASDGVILVEFIPVTAPTDPREKTTIQFGANGQFGCIERSASLLNTPVSGQAGQQVTLKISTTNTSGSPVYHVDRVRVF